MIFQKREAGFTLMELMITVAIIGIIAAVAYPSFSDSMMKSRRADAVTFLLQIQMAQEKYRSNNRVFTTTIANLGLTSTSPDGYYTVTLSSTTPAIDFQAVAAPTSKNGQNGDTTCAKIALNQNGPMSGTPTSSTECWAR